MPPNWLYNHRPLPAASQYEDKITSITLMPARIDRAAGHASAGGTVSASRRPGVEAVLVADSGDAVAPGDAPLPQDSQSYQHNVDPMESLPRLAAVIERQRRELALARADGQAADLAAMARGVLMERDGLTATTAARQLADMSAAAGIPVTEMAAAVLRQEPLSSPGLRPSELLEPPWPADSGDQALTAGERPDPADDPLAVAAAVRSRDGAELVGALAGQLAPRFGVSAVAVWLLEADGALELLGADGLSGTDTS